MSLAADLIAMAVEVHAQDDDYVARRFGMLNAILVECGTIDGGESAGLREVLRMLRDAADGAVSMHDGAPDVAPVTIARMKRFSSAINSALKEIT